MKLEIKNRKNIQGKNCVAPFINGYNVWDIPTKHWVDPVSSAVKHAWVLGYQEAIKDMRDAVNNFYKNPHDFDWKNTLEKSD